MLQPIKVSFTLVSLVAVPKAVLNKQFLRQANQPQVIVQRFVQPDRAGMFEMGGFVSSVGSTLDERRGVRGHPVRCIEKLTRFQDHFDDVFITVILGTLAGIPMKKEDVHFAAGCFVGSAGG